MSFDRRRSVVTPRWRRTWRGPVAAAAGAVLLAVAVTAAVGPDRPGGLWGVLLLGLTVRDENEPIERLVESIERFEAGESPSFSTDREDAIGRLYEAVDRLTTRVVECEERAESAGADHAESRDGSAGPSDRDRLAALYEHTNDAVARVAVREDASYVRSVNPQFEETFGYEAEAVVGERLIDLVFPTEDDVDDLISRVRAGEHVHHEVTRQTADGERRFLAQFVPLGGTDPPDEGYVIYTDVTEQREHQRRLEALVQNSSDPVYIKDRSGRYQFINEAGAEFLGRDVAEIVGEDDTALFDSETAAEIREHDEQIMETGETFSEEVIRPVDGEEHVFLDQKYPYRDEEGEIIGLMGISRDITERKVAQRELRERERRLERYREYTDDILDSLDDVFYVVGESLQFERWNRALAEATGYDDEEIAGANPLEFVVEADHETIATAMDEAFETGSARAEARIRTKDGDVVPYEFAGSTLEDPDGERVLVGIGRDVSDRKARERELEARSAAMSAAIDGMAILDADEEYTFVNQAHAEVYGYDDPEAFLGERWSMCYSEDERERLVAEVLPVLEEEGGWRGEATGLRADGTTFPQELSLTSLEEGGYICIVRDVTERRARERELERTSDLLQQTQEVAGVGGWEIDLRTEPPELTWTDQTYAIHDLPTDETIDLETAIEFYHPEDRDRVRATAERAIEDGSGYHVEARLQTAAGQERWVIVIGDPITEGDEVVAIRGSIQDVTELRERERDLRETKRRLELTLEGTNTGIWDWNLETDEVEWNDSLHRIAGLEPGEFGGTIDAVKELIHPDDRARVMESAERAIRNGDLFRTEFRYRRPDGSHVWVGTRGQLVTEDDERRLVGINNVITERKEREEELRKTKRRLELALEGTNTGLWEWDLSTDAVTWNDTMHRLVGLEPGEFEGTLGAFRNRVNPEDRSRLESELATAIERDELFQSEFRLRHADGHDIWVSVRGRVVSGDDGRRRMIGVNNDITDRKEAERRVRERERDLKEYKEYTETLLDAIDDVFYVIDEDGRLQRWNESLVETSGYDDDEVASMHAIDFFTEEDRRSIAEAMEDVFETGESRVEATVLTESGESIPYEFVASRLTDPDGNTVLTGIGRDITERVETERELSRLIENVPGFVYRARNEPDWPFEFVSDGVREMTGYDPETLESNAVLWGEAVIAEERDDLWESVQTALDERSAFDVTYPIETAGGERRWLREQGRGVYGPDGDVEALEGVVIDITERMEYQQELERTSDLLQQTQRIAGVGGWEIDTTEPPYDGIWTEQMYDVFEITPEEFDGTLEEGHEYVHPDDRERMRSNFERAIEGGEGFTSEHRIITGEGNERWLRISAEPVDGGDAVRGAALDVTDAKDREAALQTLHETARGLLGAETEEEAADLVVGAATEVLDTDDVAVYLLDESSNRLAPAAAAGAFGGDLPTVGAGDGDSLLWDSFVTATPTVFGEAKAVGPAAGGDVGAGGGLVVPVGDHGVFVLAASVGIDDETRQLVETLVATAEAAFDRLASEAVLRERDAELEARNRRLRRQIQITDIIRRIDRSLVAADSREEVESAVCDGLVGTDAVSFAWIGSLDVASDSVTARAWAGEGEEYLDAAALTTTASTPEPAAATAESGEPVVVSNVVDGMQREPWRKTALAHDFHSVLSVPLAFEEYFYGVLTVYASQPDAFDELERSVFAELGETIAHSINAIETRRSLHADTLVELRLRADGGDGFLSLIADAADCRVEYEGLASQSENGARLFLSAHGDPDAVEAALADLVAVRDYRLIDGGNEEQAAALFEVSVAGDVLPARLVRHGGRPWSITATGTDLEAVVAVSTATDVREFVETLREVLPSVELVGRRTVERPIHTKQTLVQSLFEGLTERQQEVLRTAYFAGFFEWPRRSTGEDVAEILGVTQPTINRHLRLAQQRLFDQLFESEGPAEATD